MAIPREKLSALAAEFVQIARANATQRYKNIFAGIPACERKTKQLQLEAQKNRLAARLSKEKPLRAVELEMADVEAQLEALAIA